MATKKQKYYVVWVGAKPGIYDSWDKAKAQVHGFPEAKYKSFESKTEAETAFKGKYWASFDFTKKETKETPEKIGVSHPSVKKGKSTQIISESLCVDAACSGNPGRMEYRGVYSKTGEQVFIQGPFEQGTNNIGEFLALVHGLAYLKREGRPTMPIYSDSRTGIAWVRNKKVKTELKRSPRNEKVFELIDRALFWLHNNGYQNPIIKWETEDWGEIPADFGRK